MRKHKRKLDSIIYYDPWSDVWIRYYAQKMRYRPFVSVLEVAQ